MSIVEDRYAAALLVEREGRREYLVFDDIGCMVDKAAEVAAVERFVHDYTGGGWLRADAAAFLGTEDAQVRTPMASGLIAYTSLSAAAEGQKQFGGEVMDVRAVAAWRRARMEERRQSPGGQP